ncbi:hypothetical protein H5410_022095, partial [Solanum commersonii]
MNNNPLPNNDNQEVNMITLDEEYKVPNIPNIDQADTMTSSAKIATKPDFDTKAVPLDYRSKAKGKAIDATMAY